MTKLKAKHLPQGTRLETPQEAELVEALRVKLRTGRFDVTMLKSAQRLRRILLRKRSGLSHASELMARCLACEVYDYYCRYEEAKEVVGERAEKLLKDWLAGVVETDPLLLEQQIQIALHHADCLYRLDNWGRAGEFLRRCEEVARGCLERAPCGGAFDENSREMAVRDILCRIAFSRGRLARQTGHYEESEYHFGESIEHAYARLEAASAKGDTVVYAYESAYARLTCAVALSLGHAWMLVHKGQLRAARSLLATSGILYQGTEDRIHKAFCEMLLGAIERSEAGKDHVRLQRAIKSLLMAKETFDSFNHTRYGAVAAYYLANSYLQDGQLDKAEASAKEVAELRKNDNRWEILSKTTLSRVLREKGQLDGAKSMADQARTIAEGGQHTDCKVDAIVALGEAQLLGGEREEARKQFEKALELTEGMVNPKWTGACHLHLTATFIEAEKETEALRHFRLWESLSRNIQTGFLLSLADELRQKLDDMNRDFHIRKDVSQGDLNWKQNTNNLHRFLIRQALTQSGGDVQKAADILGVSRQAVYQVINPETYNKHKNARSRANKATASGN